MCVCVCVCTHRISDDSLSEYHVLTHVCILTAALCVCVCVCVCGGDDSKFMASLGRAHLTGAARLAAPLHRHDHTIILWILTLAKSYIATLSTYSLSLCSLYVCMGAIFEF